MKHSRKANRQFILGKTPERVDRIEVLEGWVHVEPKPTLVLAEGWEDASLVLGVQPCDVLACCKREGIAVFHIPSNPAVPSNMNEIEAIKHSQRYFDCKVCGRHMTRMIDPDGRPWIQADRTLPEGGLDFHTSGVYCPNCIPRSMEAGWKRAMSLRASRVANAELMGGEGVT